MDNQTNKTMTVKELHQAVKKLGFKLSIKQFSWGPHVIYKDMEGEHMPTIFFGNTRDKWIPLIDFIKTIDSISIVDEDGQKVYGVKP